MSDARTSLPSIEDVKPGTLRICIDAMRKCTILAEPSETKDIRFRCRRSTGRLLGAAFLAICAVSSATAASQNHIPVIHVFVDDSTRAPPIAPEIYGQFIEHEGSQIYDGIWVGEKSKIANVQGYRKDVIDALKVLHVPVVRWPGGCFADQYDWRDGIGPRDKRPGRVNSEYGKTPAESNAFGTHEFLGFAEQIGAQPYISLNVGSLSALEAARWLEYITSDDSASKLVQERKRNGRDRPWKLRYVGLGNELWDCGGNMRAAFVADETRRFSSFVNVPTEPGLIKVASGPSANLGDYRYEEFADALLKNLLGVGGTPLFQAISLHYYAFPISPNSKVSKDGDTSAPPLIPATGFGEDKWANYLASALGIEAAINTVSSVMDKYDPERSVSLFVDEWGSWHKDEPDALTGSFYQQSTLLDAEVTALTLNVLHRHTDRVRMANNSEMINALHALILTKGRQMILTPTYHVFEMYKSFQGATPYRTAVAGPQYNRDGLHLPMIDVSAARAQNGKLMLSVVNLDPTHEAVIQTNLKGMASARILSGAAVDSHNTFSSPDEVRPGPFGGIYDDGSGLAFRMPAKAIVVISVDE